MLPAAWSPLDGGRSASCCLVVAQVSQKEEPPPAASACWQVRTRIWPKVSGNALGMKSFSVHDYAKMQ